MAIPVIVVSSSNVKNYQVRHVQSEMTLDNINDLNTVRVAYHSFVKVDPSEGILRGIDYRKDQAISELLIITPEKVYLIKDGYESSVDLKLRKDDYKEKIKKWTEQRNVLHKLYSLEDEKIRYENKVGTHSPDYIRVDNLIALNLRRYDPILKELYQKKQAAHSEIIRLKKVVSSDSPEYQRYEKEFLDFQGQTEAREKLLRQELHQRVVATSSEGRYLEDIDPLQEGKEKEQKDEIKKESEQKLAIFNWLVKPPIVQENKFYRNTPDGFPDYMLITSPGKRKPSFQRVDTESDTWVKENMSDFYKKIRNSHIERYARQYRELLFEYDKFSAHLVTSQALDDPLCRIERPRISTVKENTAKEIELADQEKKKVGSPKKSNNLPKALFRRIDIYARSGTHYIALDCNRDGITETFLVVERSAFYWEIQGIPNAISIYNNTDPEVQSIIGSLVQLAVRGDERLSTELKQNQEKVKKSIKERIQSEESIHRN